MYFSVGRNFRMRALIEAIPVSPGSSRKVRSRHTCVFPTAVFLTRGGEFINTRGAGASTKVSGRKKRRLVPRTGPTSPYGQNMTGASSGVFGASSGVLVTPNQETLHFVRVCVLIFYVLFLREPQLLDASSDRGDSGGAGKLSKS